MSLSKRMIDEYAKELTDLSNKEKVDVVEKINEILEPHFKKSNYIDRSNYVNGFLPKEEERKFVNIAELPVEIYIPTVLCRKDTLLNHFADKDGSFKTSYLLKNGLYLDYCSFSNYEEHSLDVLKVILSQLRNMAFSAE